MKSALLLPALLSLALGAHASVTETFTHTYALNPDGVVSLDNVSGNVEITGWDKAEVSLVAEKRASDDDALKQIAIIVDSNPAELSIKTKYGRTGGWFHWSNDSEVRYKLMVPAGARLDKIDVVNANVDVTGVHGAVTLHSVNGRIIAVGLAADTRLDTVNGGLQAEFGSLTGVHEIKIDSVNGGVTVVLPQGASATLRTSSVNGGSHIDQPIKLSDSGHRHLSGEIGSGGDPVIKIETVNGGIAVKEK